MDERTFLNNNIVYTFMTHFLLKVCCTLKTQCYFQLMVVFPLCWSFGDFFNPLFLGSRSSVFWSKLCQFDQHPYYKLDKSVSEPAIWFHQPNWNVQSKCCIKWGKNCGREHHVLQNLLKSILNLILLWLYYAFIIQTLEVKYEKLIEVFKICSFCLLCI